jgi:hypothetical protein
MVAFLESVRTADLGRTTASATAEVIRHAGEFTTVFVVSQPSGSASADGSSVAKPLERRTPLTKHT